MATEAASDAGPGPRTEKLVCVSVDLDEVDCYQKIHGLEQSTLPVHAIYDHALPRFERLFETARVPATFFAIGTNIERPENQRKLRNLAAAGHEIGNHSWHHWYDFSRRSGASIHQEIGRNQELIEQATGVRPKGFRAPGYTVSDEVFECLEDLGIIWDSSVFSCPPYYTAKAAVLAAQRLLGRRSHSILDRPSVMRSPTRPYRVGKPYWRQDCRGAVIEFPIAMTPWLRVPFIGTTLVLLGTAGAKWLAGQMVKQSFVNLELHGIDLADAEADGLQSLATVQPDLRRAVVHKYDALLATIEVFQEHGYRFVTLSDAAARLFGSGAAGSSPTGSPPGSS